MSKELTVYNEGAANEMPSTADTFVKQVPSATAVPETHVVHRRADVVVNTVTEAEVLVEDSTPSRPKPKQGDIWVINTKYDDQAQIRWGFSSPKNSRRFLVNMVENMPTDEHGGIDTSTQDIKSQVGLAQSFEEYLENLVLSEVVELISPVPDSKKWIKFLNRIGAWDNWQEKIDAGKLSLDDEDDLAIIYLSAFGLSDTEVTEAIQEYVS